MFWFTDYQGTREMAGAETGVVKVPTAESVRASLTLPALAPTAVDGTCWSAPSTVYLMALLGSGAFTAPGLPVAPTREAVQLRRMHQHIHITDIAFFPDRRLTFRRRRGSAWSHRPAISFVHSGADLPDSRTIRITVRETSPRTTKSGSAWTSTTRRPETGRGITTSTIRTSTARLPACHCAWLPVFHAGAGAAIRHEQHQDVRTHRSERGAGQLFPHRLHKDNPAGSFASLSPLASLPAPAPWALSRWPDFQSMCRRFTSTTP